MIKKLLIILLPLLLASCVTSKKVNLMQEAGKHKIPSYADTLSYEDYQVRVGDRMYIYVYSIDERVSQMFNSSGHGINASQMRQNNMGGSYDLYTYLVLEDGTIDYPMVGKVPVRGKTTREIKLLLEKELAGYIASSYTEYQVVSVEVNIVRRSFSVISDHGSGTFTIQKEKVTIYEALAMAGDIGDFGDRSQVRIIRETEGKTQIKVFDIRSKDIINSEFYYIEPNDVIYIQRIKGQSFGINSVTTTISVAATTLAFGGFVYGLIVRIMNRIDASK
jgi:polysaccharide export outer membrane protein